MLGDDSVWGVSPAITNDPMRIHTLAITDDQSILDILTHKKTAFLRPIELPQNLPPRDVDMFHRKGTDIHAITRHSGGVVNVAIKNPYGKEGDELAVLETLCVVRENDTTILTYRSTDTGVLPQTIPYDTNAQIIQPSEIPHDAVRIKLIVKEVLITRVTASGITPALHALGFSSWGEFSARWDSVFFGTPFETKNSPWAFMCFTNPNADDMRPHLNRLEDTKDSRYRFEFLSLTDPENTRYTIEERIPSHAWQCSCPNFKYGTNPCKHLTRYMPSIYTTIAHEIVQDTTGVTT